MAKTSLKGKIGLNGTPKIKLHGDSEDLITLSYWTMLEIIKGIMINNNCSFIDAFEEYFKIASNNIREFDGYSAYKLLVEKDNKK